MSPVHRKAHRMSQEVHYVCMQGQHPMAVRCRGGCGKRLVAEMDILFSILGHLYYVLSLMY